MSQDLLGRSFAHFEITAKLGEGGMGEVYRARDSKLDRDVALKVLPAAFAEDEERLARFEREAKVLASLKHPGIAVIHEVGSAVLPSPTSTAPPPHHYIVMELVEGEDLSERLERGPIPVEEAMRIALQISMALETAHEQGIVHRDLKPANVKLSSDGPSGSRVKVLDFGLARAFQAPAGATENLTRAATLTAQMTRSGVILGTAGYMSPEQASGEEADKRSDIWSFGVLVWEMLTGERLFARQSLSETLAGVLRDPIDPDRLPDETPRFLRLLLARCLDRNRDSRLRDIGEARIALAAAAGGVGVPTLLPTPGEERRAEFPGARLRVVGVVALTLAALGFGVFWGRRDSEPPEPVVRRLVASLPSALTLEIGGRAYSMALSPDGIHLAYVASEDGQRRLYLRRLDRFEARRIPDSTAAQYPFFSPDGRWLAFFAEGQLLKAAVDRGPPVVVCAADPLRGAAWAPDGNIYFSNREGSRDVQSRDDLVAASRALTAAALAFEDSDFRLVRVAAGGGDPEPVSTAQPEIDAQAHRWPHAMADGSGLITTTSGSRTNASRGNELFFLSFDDNRWSALGPGGQAQYVDPGFLLFYTGRGRVSAVPFDLSTHSMQAEPRTVLEDVYRASNWGAAFFATSRDGHLIHVPGGTQRSLMRADRSGRATRVTPHLRGFRQPTLSPDGRRLVVTIDPRPSEVWIYDLDRDAQTRLSAEGHNLDPIFTPDGRAITWTSSGDIYRAPADGSGVPELLLESPGSQYPSSWTPDGRQLVYHQETGDSFDIWAMTPGQEPWPVVQTPADEYKAKVSPDGEWIAYQSDETGRVEVYLRRFPSGAGKQPVSSGGGKFPIWSSDGRELFYAGETTVFAVDFEAGSPPRIGRPEPLFEWPSGLIHWFDVAPDGQSFVLVETDPDSAPNEFRVVLNWSRELQALFEPD
jgi:Tol biopolymer transport system component